MGVNIGMTNTIMAQSPEIGRFDEPEGQQCTSINPKNGKQKRLRLRLFCQY
jgi:hypothetical protein